ncbi:MAG: transcriptional repressor [Anaerolineales bacterium]|nr:transcriptional repressor [Anaerolineales bacterium]
MNDIDQIIETLRGKQFRITPQRELIIRALADVDEDDHLTAEEIHKRVQVHTSAVNIATVYRTLDMLVEEGLVSRIDLGGDKEVFATVHHGMHMHLVCRQCGHVLDADAQVLRDVGQYLFSEYEFVADLEHISLFGICANCQQ